MATALRLLYILHIVVYRDRSILAHVSPHDLKPPFIPLLKYSSLPDDALERVVAGNDLKKEAAVIVDPVWSRTTLADEFTEVQLLLIEMLAGMIRPSNYWEGGALWMGDQPLDWP